jgi:hypothetical protein
MSRSKKTRSDQLARRRWRHEISRRAKRESRRSGTLFVPKRKNLRKKVRRPYAYLEVPSRLSLVNNAEEVIELLEKMDWCARQRNLELDLSAVQVIGSDAVSVLLAKFHSLRDTTAIKGNYPQDASAKAVLHEVGFFDHVNSSVKVEHSPTGVILNRRNKLVEGEVARRLIHHGVFRIIGHPRSNPAVYRALLECMGNTRHHAAPPNEPPRPWWASVFADKERRQLRFTFFDAGIGIFSSISKEVAHWYRKNDSNDARLLEDMLSGNVGSRTGLPYRGKGLPTLAALCRKGELENLTIISESVQADVQSQKFGLLRRRFAGTLIYWEVNYGGHS